MENIIKFLIEKGYREIKTPAKLLILDTELMIDINRKKKIFRIGNLYYDLIKYAGLIEADKFSKNIEERISVVGYPNVETLALQIEDERPIAIIYEGKFFVSVDQLTVASSLIREAKIHHE